MPKLSVPVSSHDHAQGPADAPVTLVEYGDYQCPSCGDAHAIVKKLQKHFGEKLRFVFRNFPLPMHKYAENAAEAAEFAAAHDKFWEVHDLLYKHQKNLEDSVLARLNTQVGLKAANLERALAKHTFEARVAEDVASGNDSGVQGTPSFYINGDEYAETYDFDTMKHVIEAQLKGRNLRAGTHQA